MISSVCGGRIQAGFVEIPGTFRTHGIFTFLRSVCKVQQVHTYIVYTVHIVVIVYIVYIVYIVHI